MARCAFFTAVFALITTVAMPHTASAAKESYYIAPSHMNTAFQIMDQGFSNVFGMFQSGTGAFSFDPTTATISNLRVAIDTTSMMGPNSSAISDLSSLFEPRNFPEISFMATAPIAFKDNKATISGTLKIHGQSKPASFDGTLNQVGKSKSAGSLWSHESEAVGLSLRGAFKREDFNMGDAPEMPGRFGDTITLMIETQAIKQ